MSVVPHTANETESGPEEKAQSSPSVQDAALPPMDATVSTEAAGHEAAANAAVLQREVMRDKVAQRIAGLADKTANHTKQATASAVTASKVGIAKAAKIGRETVLPELGRTVAKLRERTRPERLLRGYRETLLWLHANVLDSAIERLFFVPTKGHVPLARLTIRGNN